MRIAMVGPFGFHPNKTMRSRAFQLARSLVQKGHGVKLFMPPWQTPAEAGREWQEDGVNIRYTTLGGGLFAITGRLVREITIWQPDVVHAFKPKAYSGLVAWWLWNFHRGRLRLVTDSDDWEGWGGWNNRAPYSMPQKHFFAWQERWGLRHCHVLTVASRTLQSLAWANGVPPEKVVYLPNGPGIGGDPGRVETRRAELGLSDRPVVLLYSRLFEFDSNRLVATLRQVRAALPDLSILAVGTGLFEAEAAAFRRQLADADMQDAFLEVGWVEEAELPDLLGAADAAIYLMDDTLLNRTKCPVKLADMLSVGLPVVAEDVGQVGEYVIHMKSGLLCPSGDVEALAKGLIMLLQDQSERQRLGVNAREHIKANFNWDRLADLAQQAYVAS